MASGPTDGVDAAEDGDGGHPVGHRRHPGARQRERATAGQTDDADLVCAQEVGDVRHVGGPVADPVVGVRIAEPGSGALDEHHPQAERLGGATTDDRQLPAATGGAVEPQHDRTGRIAVFGVAETAAVGKEEAALGAWLLAAGDAGRVAPRVGYHCIDADVSEIIVEW